MRPQPETTTRLRERYMKALERGPRKLHSHEIRLYADAVMHVRDDELARLRNQVADYERQLADAEANLRLLHAERTDHGPVS